MNLFRSARIKLTLWYLLIIMLISLFFSMIIYRSVTSELERRFSSVEQGMHQQMMRFHFRGPSQFPFLQEHLDAAKRRVFIILLYTNGLILVLAGAAGYFLAGKTLEPIEEAMKEQERFVSDASHELRTPLTALKTSMEVALREKRLSTKEAKKILEEGLEEVENLETLTSSLLNLAQTSQMENQLSFSPVSLSEIADSAWQKVKNLADQKKINLRKNLTQVILKSDRESLEKLILILLDNAIKYTPSGGEVELEVGKDSRNAFIRVSDTGIGIPEEELSRIFDRFYRVEPSRSKVEAQGYGLGLSIAQKIVEKHKGKIEVKSRLNEGTVFTVYLPL